MAIFLDHVFITCEVGAPEADVLLAQGFVEGSGNVHPGQGTANRRFFFSNFMIELLWVCDPTEATGNAVLSTGLWERWSRRGEGASRFGIVYGGTATPGSSPLLATQSYFPAYLPTGLNIEIVCGLQSAEPAIFWMPWLGADRRNRREPIDHAASIREITGVAIGVPNPDALSQAARRLCEPGLLGYFRSAAPILEIRFRSHEEQSIDCRPRLPLVFRGCS